MRSSWFDFEFGKELLGESVGADEEFFCFDLEVVVGLEDGVIGFLVKAGYFGLVEDCDSGGSGFLDEGGHHFAGVDLSLGLVKDEVVDVLEFEVSDFGSSVGVGLVEAGDGFEEEVESVDVIENLGVCDEFVSAEVLVVDGLVGEVGSEFMEAAIAAFDEGEDFVLSCGLKVVEEFGDAAEAGESGVFGAGSGGEESAFEDKNFEGGVLGFQGDGGAEADNSAADDGDIDVFEKSVLFPVAQVHL